MNTLLSYTNTNDISNKKYNYLRQKLDSYNFLHSYDPFSYDLISSILNKYIESLQKNEILQERNKENEEKESNNSLLIEVIRRENKRLQLENQSINSELNQIEARFSKSIQAKEQEILRLNKEKEEMSYLRKEYKLKIESLEKEIVLLKKRNVFLNSQVSDEYVKLNRSMISIMNKNSIGEEEKKKEVFMINDNNNDNDIEIKLKDYEINKILSSNKNNRSQIDNQIKEQEEAQEEEIKRLKNELTMKINENEELKNELISKLDKNNTNNTYNTSHISLFGSLISSSELEKLISYLKSENLNLINKSNHKEDFLMKRIIELERVNKEHKENNIKQKPKLKSNNERHIKLKESNNIKKTSKNNKENKENKGEIDKIKRDYSENNLSNKKNTSIIYENLNENQLLNELTESRESYMKLDRQYKEISSIYNSEKTILNNKLIEVNRELNKSEGEKKHLYKEVNDLRNEIDTLRNEINIKSGVLFMKQAEIEQLKN